MTALIKARSSINDTPVLLKIHETPYNKGSPITLLSEYQIREYGLVIDSVANKHRSSHGKKGTQRFDVNSWVHINFEDRGGLMGFEILPNEEGDDDRYDIITITSSEKWVPHKFQTDKYPTNDLVTIDTSIMKETNDNMSSALLSPKSTTNLLNAMSYEELTSQHNFNCESAGYPHFLNHVNEDVQELSINMCSQFNLLDPQKPIMDTHIFATSAWHRVIHREIDPKQLQPFLEYRPLRVIKKTLQRTTQMAKMTLRHPLQRHIKPRNSHMNVTRIDETFSTDPFFANVKSVYHQYIGAQMFYGTKSHTIFIYEFRKKGEFPKLYRDFIREHGAPSTLRRDNAKEEQSEEVIEINRELLIKDQYTEPHHPQQNPMESEALRYNKDHVLKVLDNTGAPESTWYFAVQYVADIHIYALIQAYLMKSLLHNTCKGAHQTYLLTFNIPSGNLSCSWIMKLYGLQPMKDLADG